MAYFTFLCGTTLTLYSLCVTHAKAFDYSLREAPEKKVFFYGFWTEQRPLAMRPEDVPCSGGKPFACTFVILKYFRKTVGKRKLLRDTVPVVFDQNLSFVLIIGSAAREL